MRLHWHRRDLRGPDNCGLATAADPESDPGGDGLVVPVFVFDDEVLDYASPPRVAFMLDALDALRSWYRDRGSDLIVARGDPRTELPALAETYGADAVVWNRDYSGLARERDDAVRAALSEAGVDTLAVHDAVVHEPGSITTNAGEHYSVYSYFWRKWRDREKPDPARAPGSESLADVEGEHLPTTSDLGFDPPDAELPDAGVEAARGRLRRFCDGPIHRYDEDRDYPARRGTSRLSVDLRWGTIGPREVYAATREAAAGADEERRDGITEFQSQLAWREFYAHVLRFNPAVVTENFREYERPIEWRDDPDGLQAWKDGETGYPIVDAGMRQLRREAYVHNRVRMIVASFLTKDLLIDWREGYAWFRERLADHDPANDSGGWQWAASTGTDAQPYFRIFNPMVQGERYDPDGEYVREYVPELRGVDAEAIHAWNELDDAERKRRAPGYPAPILDHAERREAALETFERARGED